MTINLADGSLVVTHEFCRSSSSSRRSAPGSPNFGTDPDDPEKIPRPLRFFAQLDWELQDEGERCPALGCPLMDPRSTTRETLAFKVPLHSGKV